MLITTVLLMCTCACSKHQRQQTTPVSKSQSNTSDSLMLLNFISCQRKLATVNTVEQRPSTKPDCGLSVSLRGMAGRAVRVWVRPGSDSSGSRIACDWAGGRGEAGGARSRGVRLILSPKGSNALAESPAPLWPVVWRHAACDVL